MLTRLLRLLGWTPAPVIRLRESFADLTERYQPRTPTRLPIPGRDRVQVGGRPVYQEEDTDATDTH